MQIRGLPHLLSSRHYLFKTPEFQTLSCKVRHSCLADLRSELDRVTKVIILTWRKRA